MHGNHGVVVYLPQVGATGTEIAMEHDLVPWPLQKYEPTSSVVNDTGRIQMNGRGEVLRVRGNFLMQQV